MQSLPRVLLIDDDRNIAGALSQALGASFAIEIAHNGVQAFHKIDTLEFELIVLDINLPDTSGITICQQLRGRGIQTPVLMLSGEHDVLIKIRALDAGANDYLTKPFSLGELKARLRVLQRIRPYTPRPVGQLVSNGLVLNRMTHSVTKHGIHIPLRRKEFAVLECLMEHPDSVVTRAMLTRSVWQDMEQLWTNTVEVHIKQLRDKIDRPFGEKTIHTVHGIGYKFDTTSNSVNGAQD